MLTKADFQAEIQKNISNFPAVEELYRAGDPRIHQHLDAMATMCAMLSAQIEVAQTEAIHKTRDQTVFAYMAAKGFFPTTNPERVKLRITGDWSKIAFSGGRRFLSNSGNLYLLDGDASGYSQGYVDVTATQSEVFTTSHNAVQGSPYYRVLVPMTNNDMKLSSFTITVNGEFFTFSKSFMNVKPGDRVYTVDATVDGGLIAVFGKTDVVGVQIQSGDRIEVAATYTHGLLDHVSGEEFTLEEIRSPEEAKVKIEYLSTVKQGANPITIDEMRKMTKYPALYDTNAVYLGEFELAFRRIATMYNNNIRVWNEAVHEQYAPKDVKNHNVLFISSFHTAGGNHRVGVDPVGPNDPAMKTPVIIPASELEEESNPGVISPDVAPYYESLLQQLDDTYRLMYVKAYVYQPRLIMNIRIPLGFDSGQIRDKIVADLNNIRFAFDWRVMRTVDIKKYVQKHIPALDTVSDIDVVYPDNHITNLPPWVRYNPLFTVNISTIADTVGAWNG